MDEKNKTNGKKAGVAIGAIAIALVLTFGASATMLQQSSVVKPKLTLDEAHDECPCRDTAKKIIDALQMSGISGVDFNQMGEIDPAMMCSYYGDDEAYQFIVSNAQMGLLGCGNTFNYVYVLDSQSQEAVQQQAIPQQQQHRQILFSVPAQPAQPRGITVIPSGHWEWQVGTEQRTPEEVVDELNAIRDYWCQGTEIPPGTLDPGDWTFGQAMAFCIGFTGFVLQLPARIVNLFAASVGMRFCLDLMVYSWIDHQLQEAGYADITALTIYQACFDFLTDG